MEDSELVQRLLEVGVAAYTANQASYADPSSDRLLDSVGTAALAAWLEELGRHRLIADVQPQFTHRGGGFRYRVTDEAARLASNPNRLAEFLIKIAPPKPTFDLFLSYASADGATASELRAALERKNVRCFMAERDVAVGTEWQDAIRNALIGAGRILILITPRSLNRPWVFMEIGAAWALGKSLIPALVQVNPNDLPDPIRGSQARVIETTAQRKALVKEIVG
jgi:hypothetical protein